MDKTDLTIASSLLRESVTASKETASPAGQQQQAGRHTSSPLYTADGKRLTGFKADAAKFLSDQGYSSASATAVATVEGGGFSSRSYLHSSLKTSTSAASPGRLAQYLAATSHVSSGLMPDMFGGAPMPGAALTDASGLLGAWDADATGEGTSSQPNVNVMATTVPLMRQWARVLPVLAPTSLFVTASEEGQRDTEAELPEALKEEEHSEDTGREVGAGRRRHDRRKRPRSPSSISLSSEIDRYGQTGYRWRRRDDICEDEELARIAVTSSSSSSSQRHSRSAFNGEVRALACVAAAPGVSALAATSLLHSLSRDDACALLSSEGSNRTKKADVHELAITSRNYMSTSGTLEKDEEVDDVVSFFTFSEAEYEALSNSQDQDHPQQQQQQQKPTSTTASLSTCFQFDFTSSRKLVRLYERFGNFPVVVDRWPHTDAQGVGPRHAHTRNYKFNEEGGGEEERNKEGSSSLCTGDSNIPSVEVVCAEYHRLTHGVMALRLALLQQLAEAWEENVREGTDSVDSPSHRHAMASSHGGNTTNADGEEDRLVHSMHGNALPSDAAQQKKRPKRSTGGSSSDTTKTASMASSSTIYHAAVAMIQKHPFLSSGLLEGRHSAQHQGDGNTHASDTNGSAKIKKEEEVHIKRKEMAGSTTTRTRLKELITPVTPWFTLGAEVARRSALRALLLRESEENVPYQTASRVYAELATRAAQLLLKTSTVFSPSSSSRISSNDDRGSERGGGREVLVSTFASSLCPIERSAMHAPQPEKDHFRLAIHELPGADPAALGAARATLEALYAQDDSHRLAAAAVACDGTTVEGSANAMASSLLQARRGGKRTSTKKNKTETAATDVASMQNTDLTEEEGVAPSIAYETILKAVSETVPMHCVRLETVAQAGWMLPPPPALLLGTEISDDQGSGGGTSASPSPSPTPVSTLNTDTVVGNMVNAPTAAAHSEGSPTALTPTIGANVAKGDGAAATTEAAAAAQLAAVLTNHTLVANINTVHKSLVCNRACSHIGESVLLSLPASIHRIYREVEEEMEKYLLEDRYALMDNGPLVQSLTAELRNVYTQNLLLRRYVTRLENIEAEHKKVLVDIVSATTQARVGK